MTITASTDPDVEILLSTFQGGAYLPALLESLAGQSYPAWSLLVRDDGSTDETASILASFAADHPGRVTVLSGAQTGNVGVARSFSRLLAASRAPYVMFADQDDVWLPEKIALTLRGMRDREAKAGPGRPTLVHTDLQVVEADLAPRARSHWRYQGIVPARGTTLSGMLIENIVCGCTAMLNRPLVTLVGEIPVEAGLHDWWVALVAAAFGEIVSLEAAPILWRRHGLTETDITNIAQVVRQALAGPGAMRRRLARLLDEARPRARQFLDRYGATLATRDRAAVSAFLALRESGPIGRRASVVRHRLLFTSRLRSAGLLALV